MPVKSDNFSVKSKGFTDIVDITSYVEESVAGQSIQKGTVTVFVAGSTAGITTIEYEPGLLKDIPAAFEKLAPKSGTYAHHDTWHDDNGHSHVRAALLGPSCTFPFTDKKVMLGTWQQIVLVDFDTRPRQREVILQIMGE